MDAIRGTDGTGVAAVKAGEPGMTWVLKDSGDPSRLFDRRKFHDIMRDDNMLLMGHNRFKTTGTDSWKDAHPFEFEHIIGAHNGTVTNADALIGGNKFKTDSEAIFNHINEKGVEDLMTHLVPNTKEAWALVWFDKRDHSLNMLRNKERNLYWVVDSTGTTVYWASEVSMLYLVLNHNHITFSGKKVFVIPEDVHMKWVLPLGKKIELSPPIRVECKASGSFFRTSGTKGHGGKGKQRQFHWGIGSSTTKSSSSGGITTYAKPSGNIENEVASQKVPHVCMNHLVIPGDRGVPGYYTGYYTADMIGRQMFDERAMSGCANCSSQPTWGEPIKFLRDNTFLCYECVTENPDDILSAIRDLL